MSFVEEVAVVEAEKHFPHKTQKRWSLIAEYMMKMNHALKKERGVVCGEPTMLQPCSEVYYHRRLDRRSNGIVNNSNAKK